ncbi:MAG: S8 family serine peptidase, partial [Pseudomonadales bacterium]|nr:S8 family serine peptidase [Pseudomonadales bacterium]
MGIFQYVEPDWVVFLTAVPNDPIYPQQWHHQMIDSEAGWDIHTGNSSVTVATCDTGWEPHQDLVGWKDNYNATTQLFVSQGGDASAVHYHGNATTGVAGATGNNGLGVTGVGWNLSKRMLRVSEQSSGSASLSVIQHAVRTAAEQGDQCISVSYSGVQNESNLTTAEYARSLGSLLFWSAGNTNTDMTLRNRDLDDLIVCGGTDQADNKATFSAFGKFVDLTGPAVGIVTTTIGTGGTYVTASGTSFSAPMAAGVAAVVWSADPTLTADEVELILKMGCTDKGDPGADDTYGYGRLSLKGSLDLVGNPTFHRLSLASVTGVVGAVASVPVTLENPEPVHGFSFGVLHDSGIVQLNQVVVGADLPPPAYWQATNWVSAGG